MPEDIACILSKSGGSDKEDNQEQAPKQDKPENKQVADKKADNHPKPTKPEDRNNQEKELKEKVQDKESVKEQTQEKPLKKDNPSTSDAKKEAQFKYNVNAPEFKPNPSAAPFIPVHLFNAAVHGP
jgi:archaellum component FlaD/FlaE